jgi:hypothetical protein
MYDVTRHSRKLKPKNCFRKIRVVKFGISGISGRFVRSWVWVLKVNVMYLATIRYATFDLCWPFFPKGSEKNKAAKPNY